MFTGIIEEMGVVESVRRGPKSARLTVAAGRVLAGVNVGDSIAVNGVCLTVNFFDSRFFYADVMASTMDRTNLGKLRPGERVNLERALKLGDRLGGHLVSGHIDEVGFILQKKEQDIATVVAIKASPAICRYILPRGSVAVDGVSLTVTEAGDEVFSVSLIPHTAGNVTLGWKGTGAGVNLEVDMLARYVERFLASPGKRPGEGVTMDFLTEHGFV